MNFCELPDLAEWTIQRLESASSKSSALSGMRYTMPPEMQSVINSQGQKLPWGFGIDTEKTARI